MHTDTRLWRVARAYLRDMGERNLSRDYVRDSSRILREFTQLCERRGVTSVRKIEAEELREYLGKYDRNSLSYQRLVYAVLRGFLVFAEHPLVLRFRYRPRGRGRSVTWLSPEESEKVLTSWMKPREALLIAGGLLAGLRRCELRAVTIGDLKMAVKINWLSVRGKCGPRSIPLHPEYSLVIKAYLQTIDAPDMSLAVPVSKQRYTLIIRNASRRMGVQYTSHVLRRSFARNLRLNGNRLEVVSRLLGHSNLLMTERYVGVMQDDLEEAILTLKVPQSVQVEPMPA